MKCNDPKTHAMIPNRTFLMAGQLSMAFGVVNIILNTSFFDHLPVLDFFTGFFMGFSMVMNLAFLVKYSRCGGRE